MKRLFNIIRPAKFRFRWRTPLFLIPAFAGVFFAMAVAYAGFANGEVSLPGLVAALKTPLTLFAERSPGTRIAGALRSTKPERTAAAPHERVLAETRERPTAPNTDAPAGADDGDTGGSPAGTGAPAGTNGFSPGGVTPSSFRPAASVNPLFGVPPLRTASNDGIVPLAANSGTPGSGDTPPTGDTPPGGSGTPGSNPPGSTPPGGDTPPGGSTPPGSTPPGSTPPGGDTPPGDSGTPPPGSTPPGGDTPPIGTPPTTVLPEPPTWTMMGLALFAIAMTVQRRKRAARRR